MNILTTNCLGGHIYRDVLHIQYQNPFIWSRLWNVDFCNLLEHYNEINFNKIALNTDDYVKFRITIDDLITVRYNHYLCDVHCNTLTRSGINVSYYRIWEYVVDKYFQRLKRMSNKIDLVAIDDFYGYDEHSDYQLERIINICEIHNIPLVICSDRLHEYKSEKLVIISRIYINNGKPGPGDIAGYLQQTFKCMLGVE